MPNKTTIQWTDYTSNALFATRNDNGKRGWFCTKVSDGCDHCYAETLNMRFGTKLPFNRESEPLITVRLNEREIEDAVKLDAKLGKRGQTARMFVHDMTDMFHHLVSDEMLDRCFAAWEALRHITVQVLTKRADRMRSYLSKRWADKTPDNIHVGVTIEHEIYAWRLQHLWRTPAAVRFLSLEPLLGPMPNLLTVEFLGGSVGVKDVAANLGWVIIGGESGNGARECNLAWIDDLIKQCRVADVPVFVKQLGSKPVFPDTVTGRIIPFPISDKQGGYIGDFPCHFEREWPRRVGALDREAATEVAA